MVSFAGGMYTSFIHVLILIIYTICFGWCRNGFTFSLIGIGLIQFCYGYFEALFSGVLDDDEYFICHYMLYIVVGVVFVYVWWVL